MLLLFLPEGRGNGILELETSWLSIDLERHDVDVGVVELDPGDVSTVGTEPERPGVGDDLFLVDPVGDAIEHSTRNA